MATPLQQFREREVQPTGVVPGYQNVQYTPDAFGAGIGRALGQLGGTLSDLGKMQAQLEDQRRANDALGLYTRAKDELRPWLFDQKDGAYAQQGGSAMGVERQGAAVLQDIQDRYIAEIDDPKTQEAFRKMWLRESDTTKDALARHELRELGVYKAETSKAVLLSSMQDAYSYYNDDKAIAKALDDSLRAIDANSAGLPPEALVAARSEARSQIHLAVISRWAQENPYKALEYYQANKDSMSGKDHVTATSLVEAARANRAAQEFVARQRGTSQAADRVYDAVEFAESSFRDGAVSDAGALGRMQVMPDTAREVLLRLGRAEGQLPDADLRKALLENNELNRLVGRTYLNEQLKRYNNDLEAALVAYNAGPAGADAFLQHNAGKPAGQRDYNVPGRPKIKSETEAYVQKIMGRLGAGGIAPGTRMTRENWNLQNFRPSDLMAAQDDAQWVDARAATGLDDLAGWMKSQFPGIKFSVNAGHDFKVGNGPMLGNRRGTRSRSDLPKGSAGTGSRHLHGDAFDVQTQGWSDEQKAAFIVEARKRGFGGVGFYGPAGHIHIDMGAERTWGTTPAWATEAMKTPVARVSGGVVSTGGSTAGAVPLSALPTGQNSIFQATGSSGAFIDNSPYDLNKALEEAQLIANPTERERTIAMLRVDHAQETQRAEAQRNAAKQQAWETVLSGSVKDIGPEMLAQLEPSFVSSLYSYEANRAAGGPETNWELWTRIPVDPVELARIDPYDYRPHLADQEFRKLVEMQRAAQAEVAGKATDSALLRNMRSRQEIRDDVAREMGWDPKATGTTLLGGKGKRTPYTQFSRKFDEYIEAEQRRKGAELSAVEMQDIADKLLIQGSQPGSWWGTNTVGAMDVDDPNQFTAYSSWDAVQPDDQRQLIQAYETMWGSSPDQETALDIYNRAMVVWLGGSPDGPEEERAAFRTSLEESLGRTLTSREMDIYYAKYLLRFLGR